MKAHTFALKILENAIEDLNGVYTDCSLMGDDMLAIVRRDVRETIQHLEAAAGGNTAGQEAAE